ncbi:MAG: type I-E CRISPR-associated protein Cse2/CasB [Deferrisomatales bacterium]|nr:type I-E CRISPR-associated protein Cse2/CasB [Deferrisomatales bacterium]
MSESERNRMFAQGAESSRVLLVWWKGMDQDRGGRAELRRAATPTEVTFSPCFHRLLSRLLPEDDSPNAERATNLAAIAGLAAHVKTNEEGASFAEQMAARKAPGSKNAKVGGLRFRRLLEVSDVNELYPLLIRVVRLLDRRVNLVSLANAVFWWNEKSKRDWAYAYYAKMPSEK